MNEEGFIKFNCTRKDVCLEIPHNIFEELSKWRKILYEKSLIGAYANGIGYGNISLRSSNSSFIITGTATGNYNELKKEQYAMVKSWSHNKNLVECEGRINASAESLSHGIIYETFPVVGAVIHIHNNEMWKAYNNKVATTSPKALFGTPEMAMEIQEIVSSNKENEDPILVMGGHEEGIITWGKTLEDAGNVVMGYYNGL